MTNIDVAALLEKIADLLQIKNENPYKIRAYRKAAQTIYRLDQDLNEMYREDKIGEIPGVGKAVKAKIQEILEKGSCDLYDSLMEEVPTGLLDMLNIPGVGHKTVQSIYENLGIDNLNDLLKAAEQKKIRDVPGLGAKTEQNIINGIEMFHQQGNKVLLGLALPLGEAFLDYLLSFDEVVYASLAGSLRRHCPLVGDVDILVASHNRQIIAELVGNYPEIQSITAQQEDHIAGYLSYHVPFEVIVVPPQEYYHSLVWTTGSKSHREALFAGRDRAALSGIESEEKVYRSMGLAYIPPELRENTGELKKALDEDLPTLTKLQDIRGDLHIHSNWSDGADKIQEIVEAARKLNYSYIAITDHSKSLAISGGLDEQRLSVQRRVIDALNREYTDIRILKGTEVDILKDGRLDFDDRVLKHLDIVIASVHSYFKLSREEQTERIIRVIQNEHVDIIGHLSGRLLNRRPGYELDMDRVLQAAAEHKKVLEINSHPNRLDIDENTARRARELGIKIAINSDAHHRGDLKLMRYGVYNARRAWLTPKDVINTWTIEEILDYFHR